MKSLTDYKEKENNRSFYKKRVGKYYIKAVKMGNVIDFFEYEKPVHYGFNNYSGGRKKTDDKETIEENRLKAVYKIMTKLWQYINKNFRSERAKFITFTFRDGAIKDVKNLTLANKEFNKFIMRLNYRFGDFKYIAGIDFQDKKGRGAVHYHMIFDLPFIRQKELLKIWGLGSVWINKIRGVDNIGDYVMKYLWKSVKDVRLHKRKFYLRSDNLEEPEFYFDDKARELSKVNNFKINDAVKRKSWNSEYYGKINFNQFVKNQTARGKKARKERL